MASWISATTGGAWKDDLRWDTGVVPDAVGASALFTTSNGFIVDLSQNSYTIGRLSLSNVSTVGDSARFLNGTLIMNDGPLASLRSTPRPATSSPTSTRLRDCDSTGPGEHRVNNGATFTVDGIIRNGQTRDLPAIGRGSSS